MTLNDKRPGEGGTRTLVNWDYIVCEICVKGVDRTSTEMEFRQSERPKKLRQRRQMHA
jgi:hypothetical protein